MKIGFFSNFVKEAQFITQKYLTIWTKNLILIPKLKKSFLKKKYTTQYLLVYVTFLNKELIVLERIHIVLKI